MIILKTAKLAVVSLVLISLGLWSSACQPEPLDDQIPFANFDDQLLNLSLPEYQPLSVNGGFFYKNDIGVRGVIIYRKSQTEYLVFERNCSFQPANACATVEVHASSLFMQDVCCGSSFNFSDGNPTGGPAWRPLRQYYSSVSGSMLTVTSEVVN